VTAEKEGGNPDGMKVDSLGNVYASGPAGIWVFSPTGKHLGTIKPGETPANCNWGDDGKSLYITAETGLYRIKLAVSGEKSRY
jgi:gluconolactonase